METLMGIFGAMLAMLAIFVLYLGGTAVVLNLLARLWSAEGTPTPHGPGAHPSAR